MRIIRFYKEESHRWFADIPEWEGSKDDLEMVMGADTMLDIIAEGEGEILLYFGENGNTVLNFIRESEELGEGAYYHFREYMGIHFDFRVWLCGVTCFVFGEYPVVLKFNKL